MKSVLSKDLTTLEEKRLLYVKKNTRYRSISVIFGFGVCACILVALSAQQALQVISIVIGILFLIIIFSTETLLGDNVADYDDHFKAKVLRKVLKDTYPTLSLKQSDHYAEGKLRQSKLFTEATSYSCFSELIKGYIEKTKIELSHVEVYKKSSDKYDKQIFKGVLFTADFNKHFKGETFVLPDRLEATLGNLGKQFQKMNSSREELVYLENPEFEEVFVVYSNDQVEARYILSTSLVDNLLQLKQQNQQSKIYVSFVQSKVFIAIEKHHFLKIDINKSVYDNDAIQFLLDEVDIYLALVETLKLNTRIWTKQ